MNLKTHTVGNVTYKYSLATKKWEYRFAVAGDALPYTVLIAAHGIGVATKVANVINGSLKRNVKKDGFGFIDNLARANIRTLVG